jgi:hypothetical protein
VGAERAGRRAAAGAWRRIASTAPRRSQGSARVGTTDAISTTARADVDSRAAGLARDVVDRAERARRQQRVARAPEEARVAARRARDALGEHRLADARLAGHEHDPGPRPRAPGPGRPPAPRRPYRVRAAPSPRRDRKRSRMPRRVRLSGRYTRMPTVPTWLTLGGGGHEGTNRYIGRGTARAVASRSARARARCVAAELRSDGHPHGSAATGVKSRRRGNEGPACTCSIGRGTHQRGMR